MTRYRIEHATTYSYDDAVTDSYGLAHLRPRTLAWQQVLGHELAIDPAPDDLVTREDLYGNAQTYFQITRPHTELSVRAVTEVEVTTPELDSDLLASAWERARPTESSEETAWEAVDFTFPSKKVDIPAEVVDYAARSFPAGREIGAAVVEFMHRVHSDFTYASGSTTLTTTVAELMESRRGVCQDFSHVMLAGLRGLGLAGRYVSGYLATTPPPGRPRLVGADATHAWVGCWVPGLDWVYLDPTNDRLIDTAHATVAWGRDYDDVTPVKGVIYTEAEKSRLRVSVDMAPVEDADPDS